MPGQLLPLRLLGTSSGLLGSSRSMSVLVRAFPFKLKYAGLCPGQPPRVLSHGVGADGVRAFSSRSAGPRGGGLRENRRGAFRAGSALGQGKSLVEEEAEFSDWISELKTDSFRLGLSSEGDDAGDYGGGKSKGRERGRGRDGDRESVRGGRDSFRAAVISSESDDAGDYDRCGWNRRERGRGRDGGRAGTRDRRERGRGRDGGRAGTRDRRERGRGSTPSYSTSERDSEFVDFNSIMERRRARGVGGPSRDSKSLQSRRMEFESGLDDVEVDFGSRKRERGGTGGMSASSSFAKRGKNPDLGRLRSGGRRMSFEISDEEENEEEEHDDDETDSGSEDDFYSRVGDRETVVQDTFDRISSSQEQGDAPSRPSISKGPDSYLTETRFDQCFLSPLSLKGIKAAGYERMTVVQEATLPVILKGKDVLAKAKTGTGKTVAFLLPAIEVITKLPPVDRDQKRPPINVLVICPTRELANQAAMEANTLLKFHPSIGVQVVTGGTRLALEQKNMQANPCQILVATPGRLRDHIENTPGFATRLMGVKVLILDEADHLLDMGFRRDIENIVAAVPKQRQTLLFSATVPDEVRQICHIALKRDHEFINTVEEGGEETHSQVEQLLLVAPLEKQFSMLYGILTDHISDNVNYKVLLFCTTAMVTKLVADLLSELNLNVREMHSRKPQSYRTRVSDEFRKSKGLILVTSDVSARGVDYPDVTLVVQVGLPSDREQYIHRLGRTGRKGKEGKGLLLLAPWEEFFLASIKDLPVSKASPPLIDPDTRKKVERALSHVEMKHKESAYQSWLGYYNSNKSIGRDKARLVALANEFSRSMGLDNPPAIRKLVLGKMGLSNVPGLRAK